MPTTDLQGGALLGARETGGRDAVVGYSISADFSRARCRATHAAEPAPAASRSGREKELSWRSGIRQASIKPAFSVYLAVSRGTFVPSRGRASRDRAKVAVARHLLHRRPGAGRAAPARRPADRPGLPTAAAQSLQAPIGELTSTALACPHEMFARNAMLGRRRHSRCSAQGAALHHGIHLSQSIRTCG